MGLMRLLMDYYGGLWGVLSGLTTSTDHPGSMALNLESFYRYIP